MFAQGQKLQLELWKVMEEDSRWAALTGDFAPEVFNPDRHVALRLTQEHKVHCLVDTHHNCSSTCAALSQCVALVTALSR